MIKLADILNEALEEKEIQSLAKEFMSSDSYDSGDDCKKSTGKFVNWVKKNKKFEPDVLLLAPPSKEVVKKNPSLKGKSGDGDSHIFAIVDGYGIDFTANQFPGIDNPLKITPENQIPSEYKKIGGYYTNFPDWFENSKTSIKTKFNNLPQWFRDGFKKEGFKPELNEADPKVGTGKKPKGSDRRLYTDENPNDTVRVKFKTADDIRDTLSKESFKSKSHARQSQIINLIHQRVRAAYGKAKDPEVKARLKRALDYIEKRKEASKRKTKTLNKETADPQSGKAAPYGSGYAPVKKEGTCGYDRDAKTNKMLDNPGELNEKCWPGYTKKGMKTIFGKKYPNCVKK